MAKQKRILVIVGPSGSGKSTVSRMLAERGIPRLITSTTRPPRDGERDGVDYYFKTVDQMKEEPFIEQTFYAKNVYGLTVKEVEEKLAKYDTVQVTLDKNGVSALREQFPQETKVIFFQITEQEMIERMKKRGDNLEAIQSRIAFGQSTKELEPVKGADLVVSKGSPEDITSQILRIFNK